MNTKSIWVVIGFVLFSIGILAVVLSIVGVKLSFLLWLENFGRLFAFVAKLLLILLGGIIIYLAYSDFSGEGREV